MEILSKACWSSLLGRETSFWDPVAWQLLCCCQVPTTSSLPLRGNDPFLVPMVGHNPPLSTSVLRGMHWCSDPFWCAAFHNSWTLGSDAIHCYKALYCVAVQFIREHHFAVGNMLTSQRRLFFHIPVKTNIQYGFRDFQKNYKSRTKLKSSNFEKPQRKSRIDQRAGKSNFCLGRYVTTWWKTPTHKITQRASFWTRSSPVWVLSPKGGQNKK